MPLLLLATLWPLGGIFAAASAQDLITALAPDEVERLLAEGKYRYERVNAEDGSTYFRLRLAGYMAFLFVDDCQQDRGCTTLQLYAGFSMETKPSLEQINQWNREHRFSRAYLDDENDPVLEWELDLEGGVTARAILGFIDLFEVSLREFASWVDR